MSALLSWLRSKVAANPVLVQRLREQYRNATGRQKKILALVMAVLGVATVTVGVLRLTGASNYYVRLTGNDTTGDGSTGNPWRTPFKACSSMNASTGGTLWMGSGVYTGSGINAVVPSQALQYKCNINHFRMRSENESAPATLLAADNQANLISIGSSTTDWEMDHMVLDGGSSVYACGCTRSTLMQIRNGNPPTGDNTGAATPSDIRIHDNIFQNGRDVFIYSQTLGVNIITGLSILNNSFINGGDGHNPSNGAQIGAYDPALYIKSVTGASIKGNTITGNAGPGIQLQSHIDGVTNYNNDNVIDSNIIQANGTASGPGVYLYGSFGTIMKNNLVTGNSEGVRISYLTTTTMSHNTIANNNLATSISGAPAGTGYGVYLEPTSGYTATVNQNVIQSNPGGALTTGGTSSFNGSRNVITGSVTNASAVTLTSGTAATFVGGSFQLSAGSSAINLGTTLSPTITVDILGAARDATPDAGAYEYLGTPATTTTPPATTVVGGVAGGCIRYEAESMTEGGGTMPTGTATAGYSGSGYRTWSNVGVSANWTRAVMSSATVKVGYSSTATAVRSLYFAGSPRHAVSLPSTSGTWSSFQFDTAVEGTTLASFSWDPGTDSGNILLDYIDLCDTTSTPTTIEATTTTAAPVSRVVSITAFKDTNLNGVKDTGEVGLVGAQWRIRNPAGAVTAGGYFTNTTGLVTTNVAIAASWVVQVYPPVGQSATTAALATIPASGAYAISVGACCARFTS